MPHATLLLIEHNMSSFGVKMSRDPYVEVGPLLLFPARMRNKDHMAGIGVRRLERRSSFPIPTPPPLGLRDVYDLLNKHFFFI